MVQGVSPGFIASVVRGRTRWVWVLVFLHLLPGQREALIRGIEQPARSTDPLEARVVLHLLTGQGKVVTRVVEQLTSLTHALYRRVELVRCVEHDVVVLARLRRSVHDAWHA